MSDKRDICICIFIWTLCACHHCLRFAIFLCILFCSVPFDLWAKKMLELIWHVFWVNMIPEFCIDYFIWNIWFFTVSLKLSSLLVNGSIVSDFLHVFLCDFFSPIFLLCFSLFYSSIFSLFISWVFLSVFSSLYSSILSLIQTPILSPNLSPICPIFRTKLLPTCRATFVFFVSKISDGNFLNFHVCEL